MDKNQQNFYLLSTSIHSCKSNEEKSSATKISKHVLRGYSSFTYFSFDITKITHDYYGVEDCMKNSRYKIPKEIPLVSHNESNFEYHFCINMPAEEFKGPFGWMLRRKYRNVNKFFGTNIKRTCKW